MTAPAPSLKPCPCLRKVLDACTDPQCDSYVCDQKKDAIRALCSNLAEAEKALDLALRLGREVLRWRDAENNDGFPHDTRLSIIELCEKIVSLRPTDKTTEK